MDGLKKSILYDIRKGFQELQNSLLLNVPQQHEINPISAIRQVIRITLPTSTLAEFKTLDSTIEINEKKEALCSLLKRHTDVAETYRKAIHNALSAAMSKEVQIQFTAFSRQKSEIKKLNFSKTKLYNMLMDILTSKFGGHEEKNINSFMSRWFSGAIDRYGGRKERDNIDKTNA